MTHASKAVQCTVLSAAVFCAGIGAAHAETAHASLQGNDISGIVTFTETPSGIIRVLVEADNVPPRGHGLHIHEIGECDAGTDFESAGGHIAKGLTHGTESARAPHPGDLPNVYAQDDGIVRAEFFLRGLTLQEGVERLLDDDGSAVVLHAAPDDYSTDSEGGSGARIACGVLELVR
ncbi:superoxide dismutase family protein [Chelativorans salis]|uniref:Superoxide dismutase family protein n=1 Tax=Chelativorans salis TaxID=2978478 RepID=A0ABT2LS94_9HYPH|nr:superoxide dismutase family protein [Chelativorans sp. EGI FJ00035]MCT7377407.1 superoxide dismutase family protein [Chelativorans sp. EGI FJ00035]